MHPPVHFLFSFLFNFLMFTSGVECALNSGPSPVPNVLYTQSLLPFSCVGREVKGVRKQTDSFVVSGLLHDGGLSTAQLWDAVPDACPLKHSGVGYYRMLVRRLSNSVTG